MKIEVEIIKYQSGKSGITCASNMEDFYWQLSLAYIVDVGETAGRNKSFNF